MITEIKALGFYTHLYFAFIDNFGVLQHNVKHKPAMVRFEGFPISTRFDG